jgi:hypothetical protein
VSPFTYFKQCLEEHIKGMEFRENELREEIRIKNAELKLLERERRTLELGAGNWSEESNEI